MEPASAYQGSPEPGSHQAQEPHPRCPHVENNNAGEETIYARRKQDSEEMDKPGVGRGLRDVVRARPGAAEDGGGVRQGGATDDDAAGVHELRDVVGSYVYDEEAAGDCSEDGESGPEHSHGDVGGECAPAAARQGHRQSDRMSLDAEDIGGGV